MDNHTASPSACEGALPANINTNVGDNCNADRSPRRTAATVFFSSSSSSSPCSFISAISTIDRSHAGVVDEHELVSCSFSASSSLPSSSRKTILADQDWRSGYVCEPREAISARSEPCPRLETVTSSTSSHPLCKLGHEQGMDRDPHPHLRGQQLLLQQQQASTDLDNDHNNEHCRRDHLSQSRDTMFDSDQDFPQQQDPDHDQGQGQERGVEEGQEQLPSHSEQHEVAPIDISMPLSTSMSRCLSCLSVPSASSQPLPPVHAPAPGYAFASTTVLPTPCLHMCPVASLNSSSLSYLACAMPFPHRRYGTTPSTVTSLGIAAALSTDHVVLGASEGGGGEDRVNASVPLLGAEINHASRDIGTNVRDNLVLRSSVSLPVVTSKAQRQVDIDPESPVTTTPSLLSHLLDSSRSVSVPGLCSTQPDRFFFDQPTQQLQLQDEMTPDHFITTSPSFNLDKKARRSTMVSSGRREGVAVSTSSSLEFAESSSEPSSPISSSASSSAFHSPSASITWASPLEISSGSPMAITSHFATRSGSVGSQGRGGKTRTIAKVGAGHHLSRHASRRRAEKSSFDGLPREIKILIFRYLSTFQLVRVSGVSRSWRGIAMDGSLWKVIDTTRYYRAIKDDQLRTLGTAASGFLRYANFRGCVQLSATSLSAIAEHCPNVERLNLTGCRSITSKAIADVCMNMPLLLHLDLAGLQAVNNYTLQTMAAYCRSIQSLNLAWCKQISGSGLTKLTRSCQELRNLNVSGCSSLEDRWMPMMGMNLPKLRELCLNGCSSLTDRGLIGLLSGLSVGSSKKHRKWRLKRRMASSVRVSSLGHLLINQSSCNDDNSDDNGDEDEDDDDMEKEDDDSDRDSDDGEDADGDDGAGDNSAQSSTSPTTQSNHHSQTTHEGLQTRLVYLGLSQCRLLTQEALRAISHHCGRHLRRLELSSCENLGDEGLVHLAQHCTQLRLLDLEDLTLLTDASLRTFAMYLPKLERICLSYCENVTDQGVMRMLRPASNPTTLSTATAMMMNSESASLYCSKLTHIELDNCLLVTDRLLLEFADVLEGRKAALLERRKEREKKREERRERMRQKMRKSTTTSSSLEREQCTVNKNDTERSLSLSFDQSHHAVPSDATFISSSPMNIPSRFRHIPALAEGSLSSYSSSPLQPRSVLASTLLSEEVVVKKTRPGTRIMVLTRSTSTYSTSSSYSPPLWSASIPSRRSSSTLGVNGRKGGAATVRTKKTIRPTIQVFDCRNITLEGVEAAQTRSPSLAIRSYYSWTNPSTSAPSTSAAFGGSGATEGIDGEDVDEDEYQDADGTNSNSSQTSLHHLQLQQQHLQQQFLRRNGAANLLQRARLGLVGHGNRDAQCSIL